MLAGLRSATRNWIVRIGLVVVAITMAVTLVQGDAWQTLMNVFQPQGMASVSGRTISAQQVNRQLEQFVRAQRNQGQEISQADAIEAGIHTQIIQSLIERIAIQDMAHDLGIVASTAQVASTIRQFPSAQNPLTGAFDRAAYESMLAEARYTQSEFENEIRGDLSVSMMMQALTAGARAPSSYGALLLAYESERRTVSIAQAEGSVVGAVPPPNEAQLQAFYEDSAAQLRVPEYRALTLVFARQADFAARITVPEARLQEEFEARRAGLTQAETRSFVQISAPNEAQAREAAQRLGRGEEADAVAQALSLQVVRYEQRSQTQVADSTIAQAVFALAPNAAPTAVRGRLTPWAAVQLQNVTPGVAPQFADLREQLAQEIALEEAADLVNDAVGAFDDARSGGTPIADAARAAGLTVVTVPAVDAQGRTPEGAPAEALIDQPDLIEIAFETPEGDASDFMPMDDADVIVSVDRVTPPAVRPLDEVREQLSAMWVARERGRLLRERGAQMIAAVEGGQDFAAAARAHGLTVVVPSQQIDRRGVQQLPARNLGGEIFNANVNDLVSDIRADGGAVLVAQIEAIERTDPAEAPEMVEQARAQIQQSLTQSIAEVVTVSAVERGKPRQNERLIAQAFPGADTGEAEENQ